jgi:hypothetical protein
MGNLLAKQCKSVYYNRMLIGNSISMFYFTEIQIVTRIYFAISGLCFATAKISNFGGFGKDLEDEKANFFINPLPFR